MIFIIIILCFAVYYPTLYNFYITDDLTVYLQTKDKENPFPRPKFLKYLWLQFMGKGYWNDQTDEEHIKKKKPFTNISAHLLVLILHTLVCIMIYIAFGRTTQSFLAACLFAINPFNQEASIWLSGKLYSFTAFLMLIAWWQPLFAPVFFMLPHHISAISVLTMPLLYLLLPGYYKLIALFFLWVLFEKHFQVFDRKSSKVSAYCYHKEAWNLHPRKFIIAFKFYGYYLVQGLFCLRAATFHKYNAQYLADQKATDRAYKELDIFFWIGLITLLLIGYFLFFIPVKPGKQFFGLIWFTVAILPFCNYISAGNMLVGMRYSYLANAGLMLFVSYLPLPFITLLAGRYITKLEYVFKNYKNDFWNSTFQTIEEPKHYYSWLLHGNMWFARGHFKSALQDYTEADNLYPDNFKVWFNISSVHCAFYDIQKAIIALEKAKTCDLLGQEQTKENVIKEREELIGSMFVAQKQGKPLQLRIQDIPIMS